MENNETPQPRVSAIKALLALNRMHTEFIDRSESLRCPQHDRLPTASFHCRNDGTPFAVLNGCCLAQKEATDPVANEIMERYRLSGEDRTMQ